MRIPQEHITSIKKIIAAFDPAAVVYLFGSRLDPNKRGGDIDLLVLSPVLTQNDKRSIKLKLYDCLGEQKIDLIIAESADESEFVKHALATGKLL